MRKCRRAGVPEGKRAAEIDGLNLVDTRRYGKNMLLFYQLPEK